MPRTLRTAVLAVAVFVAASGLQGQDADLILTGGRVWTGVEGAARAEAVAVRGDRILLVGTADEVLAHRGPGTRVLDVQGRYVGPGFIDNHTHFNSAGALLLGVNLLDVSDADGLVEAVRAARDRLPHGAWMTGGDWGAYEAWAMGSTGGARTDRPTFDPDRTIIDSITPGTPALLSKWDRSAYLANGRALELAGATCDWSGVECRSGRPTGRVSGEAVRRIRAAIPPKTMEQRLAEARVALARLASHGVTSFHDITPPYQFEVYRELRRRGELTARVYARPTLDKWAELAYVGIGHGFGDEWIRIGGLKGFVDGIMGNSSARFYEPYLTTGVRGSWRDSTNTGATDGPGSGMEPPGNMLRNLLGADSTRHWPQVHAIGDEAVDTLLDLFETVMDRHPDRDRRWRMIHAQVLRGPDVADRMARLGVIAEVQPYHAIDDMRWMEERIGDRSRWAYAFKTMHDAGVLLTFGSDWPGTNAAWYTSNPLHGMYAAVTRQTLDGNPPGGWYPQERIDAETALRAYTVNTAWAAGEEELKGTLEPGKLADIVVLDRDPLAVPADELKDIRVIYTIVGGGIVYSLPRNP